MNPPSPWIANSTVVSPGPDFLCIGMAKAGTGWLGDQLRHHPQFWMPPVQELAYLGRDAPALRSANRKLSRLRQRRRRRTTPRDVSFLEDITACTGAPRDLETYISFFRHKGDLLSGDISPGYCTLEEEVIGALAAKLPQLRIVLLVRDPLQRLWSHLCMWHRNGKLGENLFTAPALREFLRKSDMATERSSPTQVIARWKATAPDMALRYFYFDDIAARPETARADILAFLGADPALGKGNLSADYNRKAETWKPELTAPIRSVLLEHCADEIRACGRDLGGAAREWATRYGL